MTRRSTVGLLSLWLITLWAPLGWARQNSIQVLGQLGPTHGSTFVLDQAQMEKNATSYVAADPNFPDDGPKTFSGISLEKIMEITQADTRQIEGVTFIANNVYVTYEPLTQVLQDKVMVAYASNGRPIKKNRGGPYMVMREQTGYQGLYNWYIDTVILGTSLTPELTIVQGDQQQVLDANAIAALPGQLFNDLPPIPRGFRDPLSSPTRDTKTEGVLLKDLLPRDGFREVTLIPYVGKPVTLQREDLEFPILMLRSFDGEKILSAYGGPYSVVFPVTDHPELGRRLPQFLFFLQRLELR